MKRITIKDIAKALNMHHSTVSRSLRNDASINDETKKKVIRYAKKQGYQINRSALQLRGNASNVIGVIVPNIHHHFFSNIISFITNYAFTKGYIVSVFQSNESISQEKEIINAIIQNNITGVIASLSMETLDVAHFKQLQKYEVPLVLFDRVSNDLDVPNVLVNNVEAVKNTVALLVKKGCTKIAYLSGISSVMLYRERQDGYLSGLIKNNLAYKNIIESVEGLTIQNGMKMTRQLLCGNDEPDAVICDSHLLMQGFFAEYNEFKKHSSPQKEILAATFGGYQGLSSIYPGVVFIQQPENEIAEASFNLLLNCISDELTESKAVKSFDVSIIEN
jgi:LacI family transcriptional regulator